MPPNVVTVTPPKVPLWKKLLEANVVEKVAVCRVSGFGGGQHTMFAGTNCMVTHEVPLLVPEHPV